SSTDGPTRTFTLFPYTTLCRFTDWDQWRELQASCLDSEGFDPVEITPEGLVVGGEEAPLAQARLHCAYRFPIDPRLLGALSAAQDRKSTRLNSSHVQNSYAVFC